MRLTPGISAEAARGKLLGEIFPDAELRRLLAAIATALRSGTSTIITHALSPDILPLRTRSLQPLLHDITVSPIGQTPPDGCVIAVIDVTAATRRVRYLRDQQDARYDAVVASAPDIIITVDEDGLVQFANPAAHALRPCASIGGHQAAHLFETRNDWDAFWLGTIRHGAGQPKGLIAATQAAYFDILKPLHRAGGVVRICLSPSSCAM